MRTLKLHYDAKMYLGQDDFNRLYSFCELNKQRSRIVSQFIYNLYYDKHYLSKIGDTNKEDIHQELRKLVKGYIDLHLSVEGSKISGRPLRDTLNAFNQFRVPRQNKTTPYKTEEVYLAYKIREEQNVNFDWSMLGDFHTGSASAIEQNRPYVDVGIGHTLSYIRNKHNWKSKHIERKRAMDAFLREHTEYNQKKDEIAVFESICDQSLEWFNAPLVAGHLKNEQIIQLMTSNKFMVSDNILELHREFLYNYQLHRNPRFNPDGPDIYFGREYYTLSKPKCNGDSALFMAEFNLPELHLRHKIWIRPPQFVCSINELKINDTYSGIAFTEFKIAKNYGDNDRYTVHCSVICEEKATALEPTDKRQAVFVDFGWLHSPTYLYTKDGRARKIPPRTDGAVDYLKQYNLLRKNKKNIPENLKRKRSNTLDTGKKQFIASLIQETLSLECNEIVIEHISSRSKKFKVPQCGRVAERRTNYLASAIGARGLMDWLKFIAKRNGIKVSCFKFSKTVTKEGKQQIAGYYRPSQTCVKCNSLGIRAFKTDVGGYRRHKCGDVFCCLNGHVMNANLMAAQNMARKDHKNLKKRLPYFASNCRLTDAEEQRCMECLMTHCAAPADIECPAGEHTCVPSNWANINGNASFELACDASHGNPATHPKDER